MTYSSLYWLITAPQNLKLLALCVISIIEMNSGCSLLHSEYNDNTYVFGN